MNTAARRLEHQGLCPSGWSLNWPGVRSWSTTPGQPVILCQLKSNAGKFKKSRTYLEGLFIFAACSDGVLEGGLRTGRGVGYQSRTRHAAFGEPVGGRVRKEFAPAFLFSIIKSSVIPIVSCSLASKRELSLHIPQPRTGHAASILSIFDINLTKMGRKLRIIEFPLASVGSSSSSSSSSSSRGLVNPVLSHWGLLVRLCSVAICNVIPY
jgi:hypothetical protein